MKTIQKLATYLHPEWTIPVLCVVLLFTAIATTVTIKTRNARNQAVSRAQKMDGRIFTITEIKWNFVGDTQLTLKTDQDQDAGWIAMHSTNPLNDKVNPFFLAFTDPYGRVPIGMKVKARFRETPWTDKQSGRSYKHYTGSFLEFEEVQ